MATEIERLIIAVTAQTDQARRNLDQMERAFGSFARIAEQQAAAAGVAIGNAMVGAAMRVSRAFADVASLVSDTMADVAKSSVQMMSGFDQQMTEAFAKMGRQAPAVRRQMEELAKSLSTSGDVAFSPTQLAKGYEELASAGLDAARAMEALPFVARFAQAGAFDLGVAVKSLTTGMTAFGMASKDPLEFAANMRRFGDVAVAVGNETTTTVEKVARAMSGDAAAAARNYGMTVEQLGAALGVLASKSIEGSHASNVLGRALRLLTGAFTTHEAQWKQLGIDITDGKGNFLAFADVIAKLEKALGRFSPQARVQALKHLGIETLSQKALEPFIGMSAELKRQEELYRQTGQTAEMAAIQMESFSNLMKVARNHLESIGIEIGQVLKPTLQDVAKIAGAILGWVRAWPPALKAAAVVTGLVASGVLAVAAAIGVATLGIIAAGIAFNVAFGGVGILVGMLVTGAVALYAAVAGVVGVTLGLGAAAAHAAGLFDELRKRAIEAWEWLLPVRRALVLLWRTIETLGSAAFVALKQAAVQTWNVIATAAGVDWRSIRDAMVDAVLAAEYAILHFGKVWDLAGAGVKYAVEAMKNSFLFLFTDVVPAAGRWLLENLPAMVASAWIAAQAASASIVRAAWDWTMGGFRTLFANLVEIASKADWKAMWHGMIVAARATFGDTVIAIGLALLKLPDLVQGRRLLDDVWKPIPAHRAAEQKIDLQAPPVQDVRRVAAQAQAAARVAARHANREGALDLTPFVMPVRAEGEREKELREEFERLGRESVIGFAEFRRIRLKQIEEMDRLQRQADEALRAQERAAGEGSPFDLASKQKAHVERLDAVLFDSAEAISRVQKYRDALSGALESARQIEARREAEVAALRLARLEQELELTRQIAATRRQMERREIEVGVRPPRSFKPGPGFEAPLLPAPLELEPPPDVDLPALRNRFPRPQPVEPPAGGLGDLGELRRRLGGPEGPRPVSEDVIRQIQEANERAARRQRPDDAPISRRDVEGEAPEDAFPLRSPRLRDSQQQDPGQARMLELLASIDRRLEALNRKPNVTISETNV